MAINKKELELYKRKDLVKQISKLNKCTRYDANIWLTNYIKAIEILLSDVEKDGVDIYGFETYYVANKPCRKARNPMNGKIFYTLSGYKIGSKLSKTFINKILNKDKK